MVRHPTVRPPARPRRDNQRWATPGVRLFRQCGDAAE